MDDLVAEFSGITATTPEVARRFLDMCGGDVEQALSLWFNDEEPQRSMNNASTSTPTPPQPSSTSHQAAAPSTRNTRIGRQDVSGVIHIDSDDEDVPMDQGDDDLMDFDDDDVVQAARVARTAQEDEDAAMAKRLQEELYAQQPEIVDEEGVRAPMGRTTETLVAPTGPFPDDEEDMHSAVLEQLRRRQQARARSSNPFSQSIWDEPNSPARQPSGASSRDASQSSRAARLSELFRPPYDLMARLSWDDARTEGKDEKKWILVNLQDMTDFQCQALNRDIWKDEAVKALVRENFIFLQYNKDDVEAQQYMSFYFANRAHENPDNYPHVSIVDPRTGEQVKVWSGRPFPGAVEFHSQLVEFLDRYSLAANSKNPVMKTKRPDRTLDVDRLTEDEMLELAIQNSMAANGGSAGPSSVHDPDLLTKYDSNGNAAAAGSSEAAGKTVSAADSALATESPSSAPKPSVFSRISSGKPHTEPANNPATTTRIQFRHPEGRVIRRFDLSDPVERIYEWLKAEPLAGKEGVDFELKVMPQGRDLIDDLRKTISEAGLKNGTVMIEFLT